MLIVSAYLWIICTLIASGAQTVRNAMQRDLVETLGAGGAAYVRFIFGLPFACLFLALACGFYGNGPPLPGWTSIAWTALGAGTQIVATALMLAAMHARSFVIGVAYTKTEPVQVALFGLIFLGDHITWPVAAAIVIATAGVMLLSWPRSGAADAGSSQWQPAALGLGSASLFALSAIGYRAGILALGTPQFVLAASTILVMGLTIQCVLIIVGLSLFDRTTLIAILRAWRPSLAAGFLGAFASQFWFIAFAIETAARVRTLALVEVIFAQFVTRKIFLQRTSLREYVGMAMIIAGVALLLQH